jgi:hypothetical protein
MKAVHSSILQHSKFTIAWYIFYEELEKKSSKAPNIYKWKGNKNAIFPDFISTYHIQVLKYHTVPHKYVQLLYVDQNLLIKINKILKRKYQPEITSILCPSTQQNTICSIPFVLE